MGANEEVKLEHNPLAFNPLPLDWHNMYAAGGADRGGRMGPEAWSAMMQLPAQTMAPGRMSLQAAQSGQPMQYHQMQLTWSHHVATVQ